VKLEIRERKRNALMKREEATVSIEHGGKATPNRRQVLAEVAKLLGARPEGIIIDRIITPGGRTTSEARVLAYSRKEDVPAWRLKRMEQRLAKTKKAEERPPEKPEEAKPEEKEEAPAEKPEEPKTEKPAEASGGEAGQGAASEEAPKEGSGSEEKPAEGEKTPEEAPKEEQERPKPEEKEPGKGE
jgi:ribosomal protein S24E